MTTWIKVYNSMPTNPKVLMAGDRAAWLAVCGLCYSNEHLTDGFIPRHALPVVAPGVKGAEALAGRLVHAGLWHEVEGGWRIHDYGSHQRSAEEIRGRRDRDSERKATARSNGSPRGQIADSARKSRGVRADPRASDRGPSQDVEGRRQRADVDNNTSSDADGVDVKATDADRRLCALLRARAMARNPKFKVRSRSRWLTDMRRLRECDGSTETEIAAAVEWVFRDDFWGGVVQSPGNLREHFPRIWDRMHNTNVTPIRGGRESASDLLKAMNGGAA